MAIIVLLSAKTAPGVTTSVAALASAWPTPVVLVDADPAGGDLATGWLGSWVMDGSVRIDRGLLTYATVTRHAAAGSPSVLAEQWQPVPVAPHVRLVVGVSGPVQAESVGQAGWARVAHALTHLGELGEPAADVLVDAGRFGPAMPWPVLEAADLVLLTTRVGYRQVLAARAVVEPLRQRLASDRFGVAVCASDAAARSREVGSVLGLTVGLETPRDPAAAEVFSDGARAGEVPRGAPLVRAAGLAGTRLHHALLRMQQRPVPPRHHTSRDTRAHALLPGGEPA